MNRLELSRTSLATTQRKQVQFLEVSRRIPIGAGVMSKCQFQPIVYEPVLLVRESYM